MKKFLLRFNTECNKEQEDALCWRVLVDAEEILARKVKINVPTRTTSHILGGIKKWSIECEGDFRILADNVIEIMPPGIIPSPCVIWITGLPCSGKTTISKELLQIFTQKGIKSVMLDGDEIRDIFTLGFTKSERLQHNDNVAKWASFLERQGFMVIVSLVSPYTQARNNARKLCNKFIEVYLNTSLEVCKERDIKGMYKKAMLGEIKNFTGIDDIYEAPLECELTLDTDKMNLKQCTDTIVNFL